MEKIPFAPVTKREDKQPVVTPSMLRWRWVVGGIVIFAFIITLVSELVKAHQEQRRLRTIIERIK